LREKGRGTFKEDISTARVVRGLREKKKRRYVAEVEKPEEGRGTSWKRRRKRFRARNHLGKKRDPEKRSTLTAALAKRGVDMVLLKLPLLPGERPLSGWIPTRSVRT